ncbi:MAG TPA: pitrilysin family protein [Herpetosiphonaceae bacterium]
MPQSIHTFRLDNGLTVVVEPMPYVRSVAWTLLLHAGSANDPAGQSGAAQLLNGMVFRGAGERDARALSNALDELGVQRSGGVGTEYTTFSGALLAEDFDAALALYADVVRRPHLPPAELDAVRALTLQSIQSLNDNPVQRLFNEFNKIYFPGPFGRSTLGEPDELDQIDPAALQADHAARYRPAGGVLAIAGGVEPEQARDTAERLFGDWQGAPPTWPQPQARSGPLYHHLQQETAQTQIAVAYQSLPLGDPHYYHERLALNVLSGSMASRLFTEVRVKRGLVYTVYATPRLYRGLGLVLGYAGTQPGRAQETVEVILGELRRLGEGVTAEELNRARTGLLSALVMQGESSTARAAALAGDVFLIDRPRTLEDIRGAVEAVTIDALNEYLAQHTPQTFTVITLGPAPIDLNNHQE